MGTFAGNQNAVTGILTACFSHLRGENPNFLAMPRTPTNSSPVLNGTTDPRRRQRAHNTTKHNDKIQDRA
jgi:hypothetical protein